MACIFFCKRIEYSTQYLVLKTTHFWSDFFSFFFWEISGTFWFSEGMSKFLFDQKNHNNGDLFPRFVKKDTYIAGEIQTWFCFKSRIFVTMNYKKEMVFNHIFYTDFSTCIPISFKEKKTVYLHLEDFDTRRFITEHLALTSDVTYGLVQCSKIILLVPFYIEIIDEPLP